MAATIATRGTPLPSIPNSSLRPPASLSTTTSATSPSSRSKPSLSSLQISHEYPYTSLPATLLTFFHSRKQSAQSTSTPLPPPITSPLLIPSVTPTISSGFPFPTPLANPTYDITPQDWVLFSNTLSNSGRLSRAEKAKALTRALANSIGGIKRAQKVAEEARRKMEVRKVLGCQSNANAQTGIPNSISSETEDNSSNNINTILYLWNTHFFNPRGVKVSVEPPQDILGLTIHPESTFSTSPTTTTPHKRRLSLDSISPLPLPTSFRKVGRSGSVSSTMSTSTRSRGIVGTRARERSSETTEQKEAQERLNRFRVILMPYHPPPASEEDRNGNEAFEESEGQTGGQRGENSLDDSVFP